MSDRAADVDYGAIAPLTYEFVCPGQGGQGMTRLQPYYRDDWVTIYHGDALAVMAEMSAASVDAIVTDPPYFLPAEHYSVRKDWPRSLSDLSILEHFFRDVFAECRRVLRPSGSLTTFCDGQSYPVFYAMTYGHFDRLTDLVWDKGLIGMGKGVRRQHELILMGLPASFAFEGWTRSVLPYAPVPSRDRQHPAQKPLDLLGHLLQLVVPAGGIVMDPFAGLCTTAQAASQLGYRCIAVEAEGAYCGKAVRRLSREALVLRSQPPPKHDQSAMSFEEATP